MSYQVCDEEFIANGTPSYWKVSEKSDDQRWDFGVPYSPTKPIGELGTVDLTIQLRWSKRIMWYLPNKAMAMIR